MAISTFNGARRVAGTNSFTSLSFSGGTKEENKKLEISNHSRRGDGRIQKKSYHRS